MRPMESQKITSFISYVIDLIKLVFGAKSKQSIARIVCCSKIYL